MHIGLLWDSVSNNVGDQAIGVVLKRMLARHDIPHQVIDPFEPDTQDTSMLVIGGGELIRAPGHYFYDAFRVPGPHVLNTVGVLDGSQTSYLDEYRMVTVRSQPDAERLGRGEVSPCLTLLYDQYLPPRDPPVDLPDGAIGFHITVPFFPYSAALVDWLRSAGIGPIVWLPVTHYNADYLLMEALAAQVPGSIVLPRMDADDTFRTIGRLRALVSFSLHATLFAYTQNVPFLVTANSEKIRYFLAERNLGSWRFDTPSDIATLLPRLLDERPAFATRQQDRLRCQEVADRIFEHAEDSLRAPGQRDPFQVPATHRGAYDAEMGLYGVLTRACTGAVQREFTLRAEYGRAAEELDQLKQTRAWKLVQAWWKFKGWLRSVLQGGSRG